MRGHIVPEKVDREADLPVDVAIAAGAGHDMQHERYFLRGAEGEPELDVESKGDLEAEVTRNGLQVFSQHQLYVTPLGVAATLDTSQTYATPYEALCGVKIVVNTIYELLKAAGVPADAVEVMTETQSTGKNYVGTVTVQSPEFEGEVVAVIDQLSL